MAASSWACSACTLVHEGVAASCTTCTMCGTAKKKKTPSSGPSVRPAPRRSTAEESRASLPSGNRDRPGCAALPRFHASLFVGNEVAADAAARAGRPFSFVLSTVEPVCSATAEARRDLSTVECHFPDKVGREKDHDVVLARERIVEGAAALDAALAAGGGSALVHCAWGQNRSVAICVAWAVLYRSWDSRDAARYARDAVRAGRAYDRPRPLHNDRFVQILDGFVPNGDGRVELKATGLTSWLSAATTKRAAAERDDSEDRKRGK